MTEGLLIVRRQLARIAPLRGAVHLIRRIRRERPIKIDAGPLKGMRLRIPVDTDPWDYHRHCYASGDYEPTVSAALERLVQAGYVCVDVGAHLGYFTLLLARLVGETGRVFSFEASPANEAGVRANVALNHLERRVTSCQAAVVEKGAGSAIPLFPGRFTDRSSEWTTSLDFAAREDDEPIRREPLKVPAVALDDVFRPGMPLQVVKMDIEGAEGRALSGMTRILRDAKPTILLEYHGEVGWAGIVALMGAGYTFETLGGDLLPNPPDRHVDAPQQLVARYVSGPRGSVDAGW